MTTKDFLVVGGGIGGLASALVLARQQLRVSLWEQAPAFAPVGAGIQLGPNAVRLLDAWGLGSSLRQVAARPERVVARDALQGHVLGRMALGDAFVARYGTDYLTLHRADLHQLLWQALQKAEVDVQLNTSIRTLTPASDPSDQVVARSQNGLQVSARALIGCDGLWSAVRKLMLQDGRPLSTGHLAFRSLLPIDEVPLGMARNEVTVWLAPHLHVVCYPVRAGQWLNVVVVAKGEVAADPRDWSVATSKAVLYQTIAERAQPLAPALMHLLNACPDWLLWALHDREPMVNAASMAQGRVALLGDAAHPMRPYLAQGGAMALEDAQALGLAVAAQPENLPAALSAYATVRWQRNARVQTKSRRNGNIFHAGGWLGWARNLSLAAAGGRVMDTPWLYRY